MKLVDTIPVAYRTLKGSKLRTFITAAIIAIGIMALVGMLSATDGMEKSIADNFTRMGSNTISIRNVQTTLEFHGRRKREDFKSITYQEARKFKETLSFPSKTSISTYVAGDATIKSPFEKSDPNCQVLAVDENYLYTSGYEVSKGRNFTEKDIENGLAGCLIGKELEDKLFKNQDALESYISYKGGRYRVLGILEEKGSSFGRGGGDRMVYIPVSLARARYLPQTSSYVISVRVKDVFELEPAAYEIDGLMRSIRKLEVSEPNNFGVTRSDSMASKLIDNLKGVKFVAIFISLITLLGASVGLMNIMLVSITERTKEIGTRKALGARSRSIVLQFLVEALLICIIGGLAGIILGTVIGNVVALMVGAGFIFPFTWIVTGLIVCLVTGVVAGIYPAIKASKLDPIVALRTE